VAEAPERPALILDVDGTVWRSGRLIPGVEQAIAQLRQAGHRILYLSNNPVPADHYAARLTALGLPTPSADVLTALDITEAALAEQAPGERIYVLADDALREQLERSFPLATDPEQIDLVLATAPYDLTYERLNIAFRALRRGARFWATNADPSVVDQRYGEIPHTGAVIGALHGCTGRTVEVVTGKPSHLAAEAALRRLGRSPEQVILVGDSLDTDIELGRVAGIRSLLVLTGVTRRENLANGPSAPLAVLDSLADLPVALQTGDRGI
jgi:arabinose operon protein AraL